MEARTDLYCPNFPPKQRECTSALERRENQQEAVVPAADKVTIENCEEALLDLVENCQDVESLQELVFKTGAFSDVLHKKEARGGHPKCLLLEEAQVRHRGPGLEGAPAALLVGAYKEALRRRRTRIHSANGETVCSCSGYRLCGRHCWTVRAEDRHERSACDD